MPVKQLSQSEINVLVRKLLQFEADIYDKGYLLIDFSISDLAEITNNMN